MTEFGSLSKPDHPILDQDLEKTAEMPAEAKDCIDSLTKK